MTREMRKVTTVLTRGREFYICYNPDGKDICGEKKHYWGIESNLFGEDGHLIREINGLEGHLSQTVSECVKSVRLTAELDYIQQTTGCTAFEAIEMLAAQIQEA